MPLMPLGLLLTAAILLPLGGSAHRKTEQGNRLYLEGEFDLALRSYTEAQVGRPEAPELFYDIGNVLYRQGDFAGAAEAYGRALLSAPDDLVGAAAHNLGNARYQLKEFGEAVNAYERALRADPTAADSKRNLELALRALEQPPPKEEPQSGPPPPPKSGGPPEGQSPPEGGGAGQPQQEEPSGEGARAGQMSAEQAERMLDSLAEQERDHLREQVLAERRAQDKSPEVDW